MRALVPEDLTRGARALPEISPIALLGWVSRFWGVASKSNFDDALRWLDSQHVPERVRRACVTKAAVDAVDSTSMPYGVSIGDWSNTARGRSVLYRLLADSAVVRASFNLRTAVVTSAPTADIVPEGASIPVTRATLDNVILSPLKISAMLVCTTEMLRDTSPGGEQLLNRELLGAVSDKVDAVFFASMIDTSSPAITSSSPRADLRGALAAVRSSSAGTPRLLWVASESVADLGSTLSTTVGGFPFQDCSPAGGSLAGIPMQVSSGLASGSLALINGAAVVANGLMPTVDISDATVVQMSDTPTMSSSTPTGVGSLVSMFQVDSVALKSTAVVAFEKLRGNAISVITGINSTTWPVT